MIQKPSCKEEQTWLRAILNDWMAAHYGSTSCSSCYVDNFIYVKVNVYNLEILQKWLISKTPSSGC